MIAGAGQSRGADCPSDLGLHRLMVGEGSDVERQALRAHVDACRRCAARLAAFESVPLPPLRELPVPSPAAPRADTRRARRLPRHFALAGVLAAAAFVLVIRSGDDAGRTPGNARDVRIKGELALGVVVQRPSGETERLASRAELRAGDVIRFELAHAGPGHAAVVGIDGRRTVSVYIPQQGGPPPFLASAGTTVLPGAIRLDDAPGAERLFGLLCAETISNDRIKEAARARLAAAAGRPEQIKTLGLPCAEASFLVTKASSQ